MTLKLSAIALLAVSSFAAAQHMDIQPYVAGGTIVTGGVDDASGTQEPVVRVFGYDFGEDASDPFFAQDPGFNAPAGSGLPAGSQLRFNILSSLLYWNGSGAVSFASPAAESMTFSFGANARTVTGVSGAQTGFSLQTVGADGAVHRHLNSFLNGSDGNAVPASVDGIEAPSGIYALSMELASSSSSVAASAPFYLVFNNGLSEAAHDEAIDYVLTSIVPEPMLGGPLGAMAFALRRRRVV